MQPYFFPYIGYFQLISAVDEFVLYDNIHYITQGWINRNRIIQNKQAVMYFGIPVIGGSCSKKIYEIQADYNKVLRSKLLKILRLNYRYSSFFDETYSMIEQALIGESDSISEIDRHSILTIISHLDIRTKIQTDAFRFVDVEENLCKKYTSDCVEDEFGVNKKNQRVIWLCQKLGYHHYINPNGGVELYSKELFAKNGITLHFIKTLPYSYPQNMPGFTEHLSIIDVLMNCGKETTKEMLLRHTLI